MHVLKHLDHIGIAVESIDAQRTYYECVLGFICRSTEVLPEHGLRAAFYVPASGSDRVALELLEPTSPESPIARHLERRGPGVHHMAYAVDDLDQSLEQLRGEGIRLVDQTPRIGAHGRRIAFLHPASTFGVLIELCEN